MVNVFVLSSKSAYSDMIAWKVKKNNTLQKLYYESTRKAVLSIK